MVNIHAFSKPKMRRTFVVSLMVILAIILALPNVSYARSNTQWPEGIDGYKYTPAEKPKSGAWPYFKTDPNVKRNELTPDDVKINIQINNNKKIDDMLRNGFEKRLREDIVYSCFGKFSLSYSNMYGMIGYLPATHPKYEEYKTYLPYISKDRTTFDKDGYAHHFFDYPGDGGKDGIDHDFYFKFVADLSDTLRQAAKKKDNLQVRLVAEVYDTDGDHAHVELGFLADRGYYEEYVQQIYLKHSGKDKHWVTWHGNEWKTITSDTGALEVHVYSTEGKGADANDAEVMLPRVLIRDISAPTVESVEIQSTGLRKSINSVYDSKTEKYRAKIGDDIKYTVTFDEPVKCINTDVKLEIVSTGSTKVYAMLTDDEKKAIEDALKNNKDLYKTQFIFHYTLIEGDGVVEDGRVGKLINAQYFLDVGKNPVNVSGSGNNSSVEIEPKKYKNVRNGTTELNVIVDSKTPEINSSEQNSGGGFYATKMSENDWANGTGVVAARSAEGTIPKGLVKNTQTNIGNNDIKQNTVFSLNSKDKPIFRIVLSDMIDEKLLKMTNDPDPLKLKLNIFDYKGKVISGRNAYAELIGYRYVNQNTIQQDKGKGQQGTNQGYTELFFAYTPKASDFEGLPKDAYIIDIAAQVDNGYFIFGTDLFNKRLSDFAGNQIGQLKLAAGQSKAPANLQVMIDLLPPILVESKSKLPDPSVPVAELNNIKLVFEEKGEETTKLDIKLQVYKQIGNTDRFMAVDTKLNGQTTGEYGSLSELSGTGLKDRYIISYNVLLVKTAAKLDKSLSTDNVKYYSVEINGLTIQDPMPSVSDNYYLVYEITDKAGNSIKNIENGIPHKNIPLNIDILPPIPVKGEDGKWYTVNRTETGNAADVTFNLEDKSGLWPSFPYYTVDYNESNTSIRPNDERLYTSSDPDTAYIETDKDTRVGKTIYAKFKDILQNEMSDYIPAGPIYFDTRKIDAEYNCRNCVDGGRRKTYDLWVKIANPFSEIGSGEEGTLKISYKWVSSDKQDYDKYEEIYITGNSEQARNDTIMVSLTPEGFQQEWLKKLGKDGSAFHGIYKCYAKVELISELDGEEKVIDYIELGWHQHYFDNMPPVVDVEQLSDKYAKTPVISFSIKDDNGEASNIDFGNVENTYYTYAVKRTNTSGNAYYVDISDKYPINTYNFYREETALAGVESTNGRIVGMDENEIYVRVSVQDKAGNKTEQVIGPVLIDAVAPVVNELYLNIKDGAKSISYQDKTGFYTVVKDLADITGVALNITDNTNSGITVRSTGSSKTVQKSDGDQKGVYSGTLNLTANDFMFIEKTMGGVDHYRATLAITDEAGNITYSYIDIIVDNMAVYSGTPDASVPSNNDAYTKENVIARQYININDYETVDILRAGLSLSGSGGKVEGEPVIVVNGPESYVELTLKDNTVSSLTEPSDIYITITDPLGNISDKIYFTAKGIDRTIPTITVTSDIEHYKHEGTFTITASDNMYISGIDAALMKDGKIPDESDYFTSVWPSSALLEGESSGKSGSDYAQSYANLEILSRSGTEIKGSFYFRCLETGKYTLYIRVKDGAGNVALYPYTFDADNSIPKATYSYYPTETTGGTVSVTITTDQPVIIQKTPSGMDYTSSVSYIQNKIREFFIDGFTYWYNGEMKNLTLEELEKRLFEYWWKYPYDEICEAAQDFSKPLSSS